MGPITWAGIKLILDSGKHITEDGWRLIVSRADKPALEKLAGHEHMDMKYFRNWYQDVGEKMIVQAKERLSEIDVESLEKWLDTLF